jgi:Fe-S-cluster containining protein
MGDRCTGHCCRKVSLPFHPSDVPVILEERNRRLAGKQPNPDIEVYADFPRISTIFKYLYSSFTDVEDGTESAEGLRHFYTCTMLAANGDCTIYEDRPKMCKDYPYGDSPCMYQDCTWDEKRCPDDVRGEWLARGKCSR